MTTGRINQVAWKSRQHDASKRACARRPACGTRADATAAAHRRPEGRRTCDRRCCNSRRARGRCATNTSSTQRLQRDCSGTSGSCPPCPLEEGEGTKERTRPRFALIRHDKTEPAQCNALRGTRTEHGASPLLADGRVGIHSSGAQCSAEDRASQTRADRRWLHARAAPSQPKVRPWTEGRGQNPRPPPCTAHARQDAHKSPNMGCNVPTGKQFDPPADRRKALLETPRMEPGAALIWRTRVEVWAPTLDCRSGAPTGSSECRSIPLRRRRLLGQRGQAAWSEGRQRPTCWPGPTHPSSPFRGGNARLDPPPLPSPPTLSPWGDSGAFFPLAISPSAWQ